MLVNEINGIINYDKFSHAIVMTICI